MSAVCDSALVQLAITGRTSPVRRRPSTDGDDRYLKSKVEGASKEDSEKIDGNLLAKLLLGSQVRNLNNSIYLWKETD